MIFITWAVYENDVKGLCDKIRKEYDLTKCIGVWGVPRGGLIPAVIISHELNIPFDLCRQIPEKGSDEWVLVIDDIYESGKTYSAYTPDLCFNVVFASIYKKSKSVKGPTLYFKDLNPKKWIVFPYENFKRAYTDCQEYYDKRGK